MKKPALGPVNIKFYVPIVYNSSFSAQHNRRVQAGVQQRLRLLGEIP